MNFLFYTHCMAYVLVHCTFHYIGIHILYFGNIILCLYHTHFCILFPYILLQRHLHIYIYLVLYGYKCKINFIYKVYFRKKDMWWSKIIGSYHQHEKIKVFLFMFSYIGTFITYIVLYYMLTYFVAIEYCKPIILFWYEIRKIFTLLLLIFIFTFLKLISHNKYNVYSKFIIITYVIVFYFKDFFA